MNGREPAFAPYWEKVLLCFVIPSGSPLYRDISRGTCKSLAFTLYFLSFRKLKAKLSHGVFLAFTTHTLFCRLLTPLDDGNRRPNFVVYFLILLVYQT